MHPNSVNLAYCAGLIDGEGTISIYRRNPTKARKSTTPEFTGRVRLAMTKRLPIEIFCRTFRLPSSQIYCRQRTAPANDVFEWEARYQLAFKIVEDLLPYLHLKRPQAKILQRLAKFQASFSSRKAKTERIREIQVPGRNGKGQKIWLRQRSKKFLQECSQLCENINSLNKRGKNDSH